MYKNKFNKEIYPRLGNFISAIPALPLFFILLFSDTPNWDTPNPQIPTTTIPLISLVLMVVGILGLWLCWKGVPENDLKKYWAQISIDLGVGAVGIIFSILWIFLALLGFAKVIFI